MSNVIDLTTYRNRGKLVVDQKRGVVRGEPTQQHRRIRQQLQRINVLMTELRQLAREEQKCNET